MTSSVLKAIEMNVDMSPAAVTLRFKRVSQLRRVCLELGKMKPVVVMEAEGTEGDAAASTKPSGESRERSDLSSQRRS